MENVQSYMVNEEQMKAISEKAATKTAPLQVLPLQLPLVLKLQRAAKEADATVTPQHFISKNNVWHAAANENPHKY